MKIEHLLGRAQTKEENEYLRILRIRNQKEENEFWISGEDEYPCLVLSVLKESAVLHYFPSEGSAGLLSKGKGLGKEKESFCWHTANGELCSLPFDYVIPEKEAILAVLEFMKTGNIPKMFRWESLE